MDLFDDKLLKRNQLSYIPKIFKLSNKGILFSQETIRAIYPRIETLNQKSGFDSVMAIINILHDLSISRNLKNLSGYGFNNDAI